MEENSRNHPKIVCEHIGKTFIQKGRQQVHVLEDISLEVFDNEFLVILGPGQSGKSTLLRIIAGLERPEHGRIDLGRGFGGCWKRRKLGIHDSGHGTEGHAATVGGELQPRQA